MNLPMITSPRLQRRDAVLTAWVLLTFVLVAAVVSDALGLSLSGPAWGALGTAWTAGLTAYVAKDRGKGRPALPPLEPQKKKGGRA